MKLLFLTEFYPQDDQLIFTGGVEARVYHISKLAKKDFHCQIITSTSSQIPATALSVVSRFFYLFTAFFKALKADFDVIEGSNVVTYLPSFLAGRLKGKKTVAWIPDVLGTDWLQFGLIVGFLGLVMESLAIKLPWDHIIALSDSTKKKLINRRCVCKRISVVKAGIDPQEYQKPKSKKFTQTTIICVARLVATKRMADLIKAFAFSRGQLIIVGQGPKEPSLRHLVAKLKLTSQVKFYKNLKRQDLINLLYRSHIFCLPSVVEGFGIATVEAFACGLPAILADIQVNHEITHDKGCLFFKPQNITDLANQLNILMVNKVLYQQKVLEAKTIAQQHTWEKVYQQTKKVYEACFSH